MRHPFRRKRRDQVNTAQEYIETPYVECDHSYCAANAKFEIHVKNLLLVFCGHHKHKHEGHIIDSGYPVKQIGSKL
jgi:hypothetical protein